MQLRNFKSAKTSFCVPYIFLCFVVSVGHFKIFYLEVRSQLHNVSTSRPINCGGYKKNLIKT